MLTRNVAKGIGLVREYQEHSKGRKANEEADIADQSEAVVDAHTHGSKQDELDEDEDEEAWEIDDAQHGESEPVKASIESAKTVKQLLAAFYELHPPPPNPVRCADMPMPVILPQRRPRHRDRGFVRAYSPMLQDHGIDQQTFFDFLDGFEQAIKLHPIFHAANLAVWGAVKVVDVTAGISLTVHAAAFVIHTSLEASRRGLIVHETNRYLDGINERFFKPRGMYAMIMTYKPESDKPIEEIKASDQVEESVIKRNEGAGQRFGLSSGKTRGELAIPEAAPLIFPSFDALSDEKKESKWKEMSRFYSDYQDRQARLQYDIENPDSKLQTPGSDFKSRYSDPYSPAVQGGLVGLVTGGQRTDFRYRLKQRLGKTGPQKPRGAKRLLRQDLYYLAIVNMPSEAELAEAKKLQGRKH